MNSTPWNNIFIIPASAHRCTPYTMPYGNVAGRMVWYYSDALSVTDCCNDRVHFLAMHSSENRRYPVLYAGFTAWAANENAWTAGPHSIYILDNLIASGK